MTVKVCINQNFFRRRRKNIYMTYVPKGKDLFKKKKTFLKDTLHLYKKFIILMSGRVHITVELAIRLTYIYLTIGGPSL